MIHKKKKLVVAEILSNVVTMEKAKSWKDEHQITTVNRIIRSGQIFEVPGDLLLIGDVNPDGTVRAGGSIFIMGQLKGIAHAGVKGNNQAVIAASVMKPAQLRIADQVTLAPDQYTKKGHKMECAFMVMKRKL